jgi:putative PIN family toxin of toxin-antitoxin system
MIVVLDTSVWVSALEFGGTPERALKQAILVDRLAISDYILDEVLQIMTGKFGHDAAELARELRHNFLQDTIQTITKGSVKDVCRDPYDDAIIECAVAARAQLLISGDKDLLALGSYRRIQIVTPAEYLGGNFGR